MISIDTEIDVAAPPHEVWRVVTAFDAYGAWNPLITSIDGKAEPGATVTVHVATIGPATLPVKSTITRFEVDRELVWHSQLLMPGLFDRDHIIRIESTETGCRVRNIQTFDGPASGPAAILTEGAVRHGLRRMNEALKRQVEAASHG